MSRMPRIRSATFALLRFARMTGWSMGSGRRQRSHWRRLLTGPVPAVDRALAAPGPGGSWRRCHLGRIAELEGVGCQDLGADTRKTSWPSSTSQLAKPGGSKGGEMSCGGKMKPASAMGRCRARAPRDQRTECALSGAICPAKGTGRRWSCGANRYGGAPSDVPVDPGARGAIVDHGWHLAHRRCDNITVLALPPRSRLLGSLAIHARQLEDARFAGTTSGSSLGSAHGF